MQRQGPPSGSAGVAARTVADASRAPFTEKYLVRYQVLISSPGSRTAAQIDCLYSVNDFSIIYCHHVKCSRGEC